MKKVYLKPKIEVFLLKDEEGIAKASEIKTRPTPEVVDWEENPSTTTPIWDFEDL